MFKKLVIKNLGCFSERESSVDFSAETLLAGPNNSGKSLFLAGINLMRNYVIAGSQSMINEYYNLVNFVELVHMHEKNRAIEISLTASRGTDEQVFELRLRFGQPFNLRVKQGESWRSVGANDRDFLGSIWYLRPNRLPIPYSAVVQPTSGALQPLNPDGSNVVNFVLERWTDRDANWNIAETWLRKIDEDMTEMKTPIRGNNVYFETTFGNLPVNVSLQGSGFQNASAIVAAIVFSQENSTVIIEEPEAFLHPSSQEVIVDLINDATNNHNKQIIFSTHSCNILLPFYNDVGRDGARRGANHMSADPDKFSMWTFKKSAGEAMIKRYPIHEKTFRQFREDFKIIWG